MQKLSLAILWGLASASALASPSTFDGWLISDNASDPPIPIAVELDLGITGITGSVRTGPPQAGAGALRGDEQFGTCDLRSDLGQLTLLRMKGACSTSMATFNGKYVLSLNSGRRLAGTFKLNRKLVPGQVPGSALGTVPRSDLPGLTPMRCLKANNACLLACPRGDQNSELLCANRCKQKLKACKASKIVPPTLPDPLTEESKPVP